MTGRHRKARQPTIWWFGVWVEARANPVYHRNLYRSWLR